MLMFDSLVNAKYVLLKRSFDEEYIKHHKGTLTAGCMILGRDGDR